MTSDFITKITKVKTALEAIFVKKADRSHISYGQVDSTSTSTAFTATVTGLTSLTDGATVMLRNGYITSAEGFTLNVNGLGAKPVYNSMADATRDTTIFNINYTMLFVYDSTRVENGCWICYRGYNSDKDTNTIGYQIRTNSSTYTATDKFVRYRLLLEVDNGHYMPVNTSTSTSGTASKSSAMNTREFKIGGRIMYYGTTATVNANTQIAGVAYLWTQINLVLGYSFSNSSSGPSLTIGEPVYMIAKPSTTNKGMAKLNTPYYTQSLPSTADGLIYIYLGQATDATHVELVLDHPIYEYYGSGIRLYREYYDSGEVDTLLSGKSDVGHTHTIDSSLSSTSTNPVQNKVINSALAGKSDTGHTHTKSQITDFPTIPDVSGKIDTAGTGLSKSGTTLNHSNSITALTTATLKKIKYDAQGHITGVSDVSGSDLPSHTHNYSTFSGNYEDLTNKPTIPLATSDLTNDGNGEEPFLTHSDISAVGITNSYEDLDDKPTIPSAYTHPNTHPASMITGLATVATSGKASDLNNDSGFLTSHNPIDSSLLSSSENAVQNKVINTALGNKVDKVSGKGLSTNDFDATYKGYVDNLVSSSNTTKNAHVHGSVGSGGTLNSDISTVNKIAVTDSSNNLKTISQLPYSKVSGTPNIPQSLSDLELEDNSTVYLSNGNELVWFDSINNSVSLLDGMLYYDMSNQSIMYNGTDTIATLSDIPSIPTVPTASTTTPSADTTNGSYGSGTSYARSNHSHPKSSLYAEATHTHSQYANIEDIPTHLEDLTLSNDEGISSEGGHLLINNQTSGDYIGFADDLLTYDTANSVLKYNNEELATVNDIPTTTSQLTNNSGFLTSHQSLTPTRVYNCTSFNSTYIDTSATNNLSLYKLGDSLYFLRYFIATKNLVYSTTEYNINSDSIPSDYRPPGDRTFYVGTNIAENARIIIKSTGKVTISATSNNKTIYTAGTLTYWW